MIDGKNKKIKSQNHSHIKEKEINDSLDSEDDKTIIKWRDAKNKKIEKKIEKKQQCKKTLLVRTFSSDDLSDSSTVSESNTDTADSTETVDGDTAQISDGSDGKDEPPVKNKIVPKNSNEIFKELIKRQLPDVPSQWRLNINDIKRICKYISTSIFDEKNCCTWNGYITNMNNSNKGTYVNFYFRNKKVALHRLLYSNFMATLDSSEYLKFNCENKGICCNVYHYEKYKYSKNCNIIKKEPRQKENKNNIKNVSIVGADDGENLIIDFD